MLFFGKHTPRWEIVLRGECFLFYAMTSVGGNLTRGENPKHCFLKPYPGGYMIAQQNSCKHKKHIISSSRYTRDDQDLCKQLVCLKTRRFFICSDAKIAKTIAQYKKYARSTSEQIFPGGGSRLGGAGGGVLAYLTPPRGHGANRRFNALRPSLGWGGAKTI